MIVICSYTAFPLPLPFGPWPANDPSTGTSCLIVLYRPATRDEYEASQHAQGLPIDTEARYFYEVSMD